MISAFGVDHGEFVSKAAPSMKSLAGMTDPRKLARAQGRIGGKIGIGLRLHNHTSNTQALMVDLRIGYIKANGAASPKVFKLKALQLAPGASAELQKQISLADMTTRKHYPGQHQVEVLLNGQPMPLGSFQLMP